MLLILTFLVLHFFNFYFIKLGLVQGDPEDFYTVAHNLFKIPAYNYIYLTCFALLGLHLFHAFSSAFQTLGLNHRIWTPVVNVFAWIYAILHTCRFCIYFNITLALQIEKHNIMGKLNSKIPDGPLARKWTRYKASAKLVNPANKKKLEIIVVGTGLSGAGAASALGELGYSVKNFCYQDSPRRAHSVAAQGGINAAKNYQNDGDSVYRLFYDMIKGGDYRAREANVYRAAEVSNQVIDHFTALGVPFARDYGGTLDTRSFGGVQVSRTFYAKGQTGQQCLLGCYSSLNRQIKKGNVKMFPRREMLDLVVIDGKARGIIARNLITGEIERHGAHAVVLATGGYGTIYYHVDPCSQFECISSMESPQKGCILCKSELCADTSHLRASAERLPVEAHTHVGISSQRRTRLGPESQR